MKVKELIRILNVCNPEDEVIMSSDSEGNNYSPLSDWSESTYGPESTYSGYIYPKKITEKMMEQGYTEEDLYCGEDGIDAVVLYPTN